MRPRLILVGTALLLTSALALAQQGPESLLPPGFDRPAAKPAPRPAEPAAAAKPALQAAPVSGASTSAIAAAPAEGPVALPSNLPSLDKLAAMTPDELAELLGNKAKVDMPPGARRAMKQLGVLDESEGGLPSWTLRRQDAALVRGLLEKNNGQMVSRWGHILLRRALASRLDAPAGMNPADFVALRTALLVRMGEGTAARALAQDVDAANYNPALTSAATDAFIQSGDVTGVCPVVAWQGGARKDKQWQLLQAICAAFSSNGSRGMTQFDRIGPGDGFERVDLLLAQKYAGAAGRAQRAVKIEWDDVPALTPWRYGLASAIGLEPPSGLMDDAPFWLRAMAATSPAAPLPARASGADVAGGAGILSSAAMVDLYSQIYSAGTSGEWGDRAGQLQSAYLATSPADRLAAMKQLWGSGSESYSRQVLTAYAAARLPVDASFASDAPGIISSMLCAGLDANALRWGQVVPEGSLGWAMLALVRTDAGNGVGSGDVDSFHGDDKSIDKRKTRFLIAGLAGLNRLSADKAADMARQYDFQLDHPSRWALLIDKAAEVGNPTLVALLAGAGMQGAGWERMTPHNLYHIVSALNRVGLSAEARMIAAEAVARG